MTEKKKTTGIKNWPEDDRPREKLLKKGAGALSNSELLAILLRTGTTGTSALDLARKVLKKFGTFRNYLRRHMRIPDYSVHLFRSTLSTHSARLCPPVPLDSVHPF
jgi:hypothetical protein